MAGWYGGIKPEEMATAGHTFVWTEGAVDARRISKKNDGRVSGTMYGVVRPEFKDNCSRRVDCVRFIPWMADGKVLVLVSQNDYPGDTWVTVLPLAHVQEWMKERNLLDVEA